MQGVEDRAIDPDVADEIANGDDPEGVVRRLRLDARLPDE
jgi:hypothetical protein